MTVAFEKTRASVDALAHISELTGAKVRIFLYEVAEGVSNYRSMHSLTQQVEHQYHGRFLIELVQNSHDAFSEQLSGTGNRIRDRLRPDGFASRVSSCGQRRSTLFPVQFRTSIATWSE